MDNNPQKHLRAAFAEAAEIAKLVPEHLQEAAFNRALDALLGKPVESTEATSDSANGLRKKTKLHKRTKDTAETGSDTVGVLCEKLDRTQHPEITAKSSAIDNALRVMRAARDECGIEWLSPSQIAAVLKTKFLVRVDRTTLSKTLGAAGSLVDRKPEGNGFLYRLMGAGEEHLDSSSTRSGHAARPRKSRRASKNRSAPAGKVEPATPTKPAKRGRATGGRNRPGPKKMLEDLIAEGYFDSPRTIGEIIGYVAKKKAHAYKPTDLSPSLIRLLRSDKLEREHNADNQFVYHKP